jgi:hypothetical protein
VSKIIPGKKNSNSIEKPQPGGARKNTLIVAAVLAVLAAWNVYRHRPLLAETLGGLAVVLCLLALVSPSGAAWFNRGWMAAATALGYVNSRILLSLVYYGVVMPIGLLLRLKGYDPLSRRAQPGNSYWVPRKSARQSKSGFERPF